MTFKKKEITEVTDDAQASVATLTETKNETVLPTLPTVDHYLSQMRASDEGADRTSLRFKDGFDMRPWQFRGFRYDETMKADMVRRIKNDGFVKIERGGGILGLNFDDWFEEEAWNGNFITEGMMIDRTTGAGFPEYYWYVRPIAAYKARQKIETDHSGEYVNVKSNAKKQGQWTGERAGLVTVNDYEVGDEQDPSGW